MGNRIETPAELLTLIDREMKNLEGELNDHPFLREYVNLDSISRELKTEIAHQAMKAGFSMRVPIGRLRDFKFFKAESFEFFEANPNSLDQKRMEVLKFKNFYMRWAKNLIAELNKAKLQNRWSWMQIKPVAQALADLEMNAPKKEESKGFSFKLLTLAENEDMIERKFS